MAERNMLHGAEQAEQDRQHDSTLAANKIMQSADQDEPVTQGQQ